MKKGFLICLTLLALGSCKKDKQVIDKLVETKLLGTWELDSQSISLAKECCEFIHFSIDEDNYADLKGHFRAYDDMTYDHNGTFELNTSAKTITFVFDGKTSVLEYRTDGFFLSTTDKTENPVLIRTYVKL